MKILFTKNNRIGSRLIRWVTGEAFSHVALEFGNKFVCHAKFSGIDLDFASAFRSHNEVVCAATVETNDKKTLLSLAQYENTTYDYLALLYLGVRLLVRRLTGLSLPQNNLWQTPGRFICTEFASKIALGIEDSTITPGQLYRRLTQNER